MMGTLPTVTLQLMPTAISENGGSATVTARLSQVSAETTRVTVSAAAVSPAVEGDFMLSTNKTLTITAGQITSSGTVTITANNNNVDAPSKTVMVMGTATNSGGGDGAIERDAKYHRRRRSSDGDARVDADLDRRERRVHNRDGEVEPDID